MKLYSVKEVRELTGLSRKQLFEYEKSIPPVSRQDNAGETHRGYKLYDKDGLDKLILAALFAELGAGPQRINALFGSSGFDRKAVINDLIREAKKERAHLNDIISVATYLKELDTSQFPFNIFQVNSLHKMATLIREDLNSPDTKKVAEVANDKAKKKKLFDIFNGFTRLNRDHPDSEEAFRQVELLIDYLKKDLEISNWQKYLSGLCMALAFADEYKAYVDGNTSEGLSDFISESIARYQINGFLGESEELWYELDSINTRKFSDPKVKKTIMLLAERYYDWYGFKELSEVTNSIRGLYLTSKYEGDDTDEEKESLRFLVSALEYYMK